MLGQGHPDVPRKRLEGVRRLEEGGDRASRGGANLDGMTAHEREGK